MACKHLGQKQELGEELTSGEPQEIHYIPICMLGRKPNFIGWLNKCNETSENDGCWHWAEHYPDKFDEEFNKR